MTQELITGVLLIGFVGVMWTFALAIAADDRRAGTKEHTHDASETGSDEPASHRPPAQRGMAA